MSVPSRFAVRLVGVSFVDGYPDVVYRLKARLDLHPDRDALPARLVRDPDNPVDINAVAVHVDGIGHVGHLPAHLAGRLAPLLDAGELWSAGIDEVNITPGAEDRPGVMIRCARA